MRHPYFFLLFGVFLILYGIINSYIFIHGYTMLPAFGISPALYICIFISFSTTYILGEYIQQRRSSILSDILITLGSLWFVGMVHFFFLSFLYDMLLLIDYWTQSLGEYRGHIAYFMTLGGVLGTIIFIIIGYINAKSPKTRYFSLTIKKKNPIHRKLTFAVASDIHLGPTNGVRHIQRIVKKINRLNPDIILLPGDVMDGELDPVIRRDLGSYLRKLEAQYGVYAILGNHEYIGGMERAATYLQDHGITLLQDESIHIAGITIIGRDDLSSARFGQQRQPLESLVKKLDTRRLLVLMDHQPKKLRETQKNGIDIQFSGHTHNGQLWPLNLIVKRLFELPHGYKKRGNTHIFVCTGVGTWGPPVRTNARPDILCVTVEFE